MISIDAANLIYWISLFILLLTRSAAVLLAMPILSANFVFPLYRVILSALLSFLILPAQPLLNLPDPFSLLFVNLILQQIIIGVAIGFVFQIVFQIFVLAGQIIAMQGGLGFASMMDPQTKVNIPTVSQLYLLLVSLLFLSFDGHLMILDFLNQSFVILPVDYDQNLSQLLWQVLGEISWMFAEGVHIALPIMTALLIVNFSFGIMAKAAPQLNVFTLGFPITMLFAIVFMALSLSLFMAPLHDFIEHGFNNLQQFLEAVND